MEERRLAPRKASQNQQRASAPVVAYRDERSFSATSSAAEEAPHKEVFVQQSERGIIFPRFSSATDRMLFAEGEVYCSTCCPALGAYSVEKDEVCEECTQHHESAIAKSVI